MALNASPAAGSYPWWLDVETSNSWNGTTTANSTAIQGFYDYLTAVKVPVVGVYSTKSQWTSITEAW